MKPVGGNPFTRVIRLTRLVYSPIHKTSAPVHGATADMKLVRMHLLSPSPRPSVACAPAPLCAVVFLCAAPSPLEAGGLDQLRLHKLNPFRQADPAVVSQETYLAKPLKIEGERVCLFPFEIRQGGEPLPPRLAPALAEAMTYLVPKDPTVSLSVRPGDDLADWEAPAFDVEAAMLRTARERGCTLLLEGVTHRAYRKPGGGYHIDASIALYAVEADARTLRWRGRKTLDWRRLRPRDECLRLFAENVVQSWLEPVPPKASKKQAARQKSAQQKAARAKQESKPTTNAGKTIVPPTKVQSKTSAHASPRTLLRRDPLPRVPNQAAADGLRRSPD